MPPTAVELAIQDTDAALALSPNGQGDLPPPERRRRTSTRPPTDGPAPTPFDASSRFDRTFTFEIGRKPGFLDGRPGMHWTINGEIYPDVPVFVVERGDLVKVTIENDTDSVHPMHLHGHHALVLSRDGSAVSGSPWWTDTLDVEPDERYEIAFRADNPGIWMDHCHNLPHAAQGLTMHVAYAGVQTPFRVGGPGTTTPSRQAQTPPAHALQPSLAPPGVAAQSTAARPRIRERVDRMEDPDHGNLEAEPGEQQLQDQQPEEAKRLEDRPPAHAGAERDEDEQEPREQDQVAEAGVEAPAVVEDVLGRQRRPRPCWPCRTRRSRPGRSGPRRPRRRSRPTRDTPHTRLTSRSLTGGA